MQINANDTGVDSAAKVTWSPTQKGLAWLSLENENECLRNELKVMREHNELLELEKLAIVRAHCDMALLVKELRTALAVYERWEKDRQARETEGE